MPSTTTQRRLAAQFIEATNSSRESAQIYLKISNYDLNAAVNRYFSSGGSAAEMSAGESQQRKQLKDKLNQMFDELLNEEDTEGTAAGELPNALGASSTMAYIELLGANPENYGMFVVIDIVKAETMGEITRTGFVEGWAQVFDEEKVPADLSAHKRLVKARLNQVQVDDAYYKRLYQLAFQIGKNQKAMPMDMALVMWSVLFDPQPHRAWQSANINWLEQWQTYLREKFWVPEPGADADDDEAGKWTRTVSKDLWNQTLVFAQKAIKDESLGFWSEEQAWPGIIDEFVVWAKDRGFVPAAAKPAAEQDMDVDE